MDIRRFEEEDWPQVWSIIREVVRAGDTYTYDPHLTEEAARSLWVQEPPGLTVVAVEGDRILGTGRMGPNRAGPGSHVANASYMVAGEARGRGVGTALCRYSLEWAREQGYAGMQFNAVAASNTDAIEIYRRLGFEIVGTVPGGFAHPGIGRVGLHIMYRDLAEPVR
jgi:ribosomal protein S18 acetylase RimI-like enzyme